MTDKPTVTEADINLAEAISNGFRGYSGAAIKTVSPADLAETLARHRAQQTARSGDNVCRDNELTPEFCAMTALQKWETLTLHGLLGTDEPWIEHMRQTLRDDAARLSGRFGFDKEWCINMARQEVGLDIGAGVLAIDPAMAARSGDVGRDALDRIEATIDAAERCMNASPFWDDNTRHAGKALLAYPRSQIAHERAALTTPPADDDGLPDYLRLTIEESRKLSEAEGLREAATSLLDRMTSTYRARNGREVGIQGDDGEKCYIVHSDEITALRQALSDHPRRVGATSAKNAPVQNSRDGDAK